MCPQKGILSITHFDSHDLDEPCERVPSLSLMSNKNVIFSNLDKHLASKKHQEAMRVRQKLASDRGNSQPAAAAEEPSECCE